MSFNCCSSLVTLCSCKTVHHPVHIEARQLRMIFETCACDTFICMFLLTMWHVSGATRLFVTLIWKMFFLILQRYIDLVILTFDLLTSKCISILECLSLKSLLKFFLLIHAWAARQTGARKTQLELEIQDRKMTNVPYTHDSDNHVKFWTVCYFLY